MAAKATVFKPKVLGRFAQRGARRRNRRPSRPKRPLTIKSILARAGAHYKRTGKWPNAKSGRVYDAPFQTWGAVNAALVRGHRGLAGGTSLARLLVQQRGMRSTSALPRLTIRQVLAWADAYHEQTGKWPTERAGAIEGSSGETWMRISVALRNGFRGLPAGRSLARLLAKYRRARNHMALPSLSIEQILKWADTEHRRTGRWPTSRSGPVMDARGETWHGIDSALHLGSRGLPAGLSLRRLLTKYCGVPKRWPLRPPLAIEQILKWADAQHRRTGRWPNVRSRVHGVPGGRWDAISSALAKGYRGLPGGTTLRQLLIQHGRIKPDRRPARRS